MRRFQGRVKAAVILTAVLLPALLLAGLLLGKKSYGPLSVLLVLLAMLPFFVRFEHRRPRARDLMPIAVMAAVSVAGRLAFTALPQFKPVLAVAIIAGLVFGAESGFLTGALSMLVSNLFFGQGPWTPWQMFACGLAGWGAGFLRARGLLRGRPAVCIFGVLSGYVYGGLTNIWVVASVVRPFSVPGVLVVYAQSFPFDTILAAATAFFLLVLERPLVKKLGRVKEKFGLLEDL